MSRRMVRVLIVAAVLIGAGIVCMAMFACQASTTVTGAKAQASSVTRTTSIKTGAPPAPPAPPPAPTIRIRVGPRPPAPEPAK